MPQANSPHHALAWHRPPEIHWPRLIELAIHRLQEAATRRHGPLWQALAATVPVYRTDGQARRRRLRSDGACNLVALLSAILATADLDRGLIATPAGHDTERRWDRRTWAELDFRAFGPEVPQERSQRRTERHARALIDAGLLRIIPWRTVDGQGNWRSLPGLKFVADRLWRMLGLYDQLCALRKERDRRRGQDRAHRLIAMMDGDRRRKNRAAGDDPDPIPMPASARSMPHAGAPPDPEPPRRASPEVAAAEIAKIRKLLGGA